MRQQRFETNLTMKRRRNQREGAGTGGSISPRQAMSLAKASPAGLVAGTAADASIGFLTGQGMTTEQIQQMAGRGCVKMLWNSLWLTLGHAIYPLVIIFYATWSSDFVKKYFPQVGEEWIPRDIVKKIPKALLIPLKLAEILALSFIMFWTLMLDLACVGMLAILLAILMTVT